MEWSNTGHVFWAEKTLVGEQQWKNILEMTMYVGIKQNTTSKPRVQWNYKIKL